MSAPRIGIVISTIRDGRFATVPTTWIAELGSHHPDLTFEIVDLRDHRLPLYGDATGLDPLDPHGVSIRGWARKMNEMDGYIFVTGEYNHSISSVLKNALDYLGSQLHRKPAAFIGYGPIGSARAIEQLRLILIEFQMAPIRNAVHIGMEPYIAVSSAESRLHEFKHLNERAHQMLDDLAWWTSTLKRARAVPKHLPLELEAEVPTT